MGAGAVGCYFGGLLARAGAPVTLIARPEHVGPINQEGLVVETGQSRLKIRLEASAQAAAASDADIVLFCVKTLDTEDAARCMAPHLKREAVVISLQNGVDNVDRIRAATGIAAVPAVVYVAVEMVAPGHVRHSGRGDLILGEREDLASIFKDAGIPCVVSTNIEGALWTKMILNCAYNPISALTRARYEGILGNPWTRDLVILIVKEAVRVADAAGVRLTSSNMIEDAIRLGESMGKATSSTAQDLARRKRTEIDAFNGYVARRGAELGVAAPINKTLHALVKLLEENVS
jgi:2-dehydropantoate 2-reductase